MVREGPMQSGDIQLRSQMWIFEGKNKSVLRINKCKGPEVENMCDRFMAAVE